MTGKKLLPTSTKPVSFSLSYETAAALEHVLNAQSVIAEKEKGEGRTALAQSMDKLVPFWNALNVYLANPPKTKE